jgi:hypothetical protein
LNDWLRVAASAVGQAVIEEPLKRVSMWRIRASGKVPFVHLLFRP